MLATVAAARRAGRRRWEVASAATAAVVVSIAPWVSPWHAAVLAGANPSDAGARVCGADPRARPGSTDTEPTPRPKLKTPRRPPYRPRLDPQLDPPHRPQIDPVSDPSRPQVDHTRTPHLDTTRGGPVARCTHAARRDRLQPARSLMCWTVAQVSALRARTWTTCCVSGAGLGRNVECRIGPESAPADFADIGAEHTKRILQTRALSAPVRPKLRQIRSRGRSSCSDSCRELPPSPTQTQHLPQPGPLGYERPPVKVPASAIGTSPRVARPGYSTGIIR